MRAHKSILTYITQSFSSVGLLFITFFTTPLILKYVGDVNYGAFRLIMEYLAYFKLLEFGLYTTLNIEFSKSISSNDSSRINSIFNSAIKSYSKVVLISLIVILMAFIFKGHIRGIAQINGVTLLYACIIIALNTLLSPLFPLQAYLESNQQGYIVQSANFINKLCVSIGCLIFSYLGFGLHGLFLSIFIANIIYFATLKRSVPLQFKNIFQINKTNDSNVFNNENVKSTRRDLFFFDIAGKINLSSDTIILSFYYDIATITTFFISQRLIGIISGLINGISNSTWSALGNMYFNKEYKLFRKQTYFLTKISAVVSCILLIPLMLVNSKFISLWVGENYDAGFIFNVIIALNGFTQALMGLWGWILSATDKTKFARKDLIITTILNLSLSIIFTKTQGIYGPVLGTLSSCLIFSIIYKHFIFRKVYQFQIRKLLYAWLPSLGYFLICIGLYYHYQNILLTNFKWPLFFVQCALIGVVNALVVLLILVNNEERSFILNKVKNIYAKII